MFEWYKKRQKKKRDAIANTVVERLCNQGAWQKFLPPVALRDKIYMVTENGSIYCMYIDNAEGREQIVKIHTINN